jgi:D-threo-aldose 1-dehydrogenase
VTGLDSLPDLLAPRPLGRTGLTVPGICVGTSSLGNMPDLYRYEVGTDQALATLREVFASPFTFVDTSNNYGGGESERRIGAALAETGGRAPGMVLATKVDPLPDSADFSGARVRESVAESGQRLGLDHFQLVYLHDPERITFAEATAPDGPLAALVALKNEGVIDHLGVAGGPIDMTLRFVDLGVFDVAITHNRWTLVDTSAEPLLARAAAGEIAVVNGAPYGGGILVKGPKVQPDYAYRPASAATLARVQAMEDACDTYEVPLAAAALQFSLRDPRIASTIVGISAPGRVQQTLDLAAHPIPDELWDALAPIIAEGLPGV